MLKSMTGYGRGEYSKDGIWIIVELRSLNNRYRDIVLRIPSNFQWLDVNIRSMVSNRVKRGRVEVSVKMTNTGEIPEYDLELNIPLASSYVELIRELGEQFGLDTSIRAESLCQIKDILLFKPRSMETEWLQPALQEALKQALDALDAMRTREGKAIEDDFGKRLASLRQILDGVSGRAPELVVEYRDRLKNRVNRILDGMDLDLDNGRLVQEVVFFAERSDITEEVVRLKSHLSQFYEYLNKGGPVGRKLDFLIQEMNREVNTIGSKAGDTFISKHIVEMKGEIERLREQVQNVE